KSSRGYGRASHIEKPAMDQIESHTGPSAGTNSETTLHNRILFERVMDALSELTPHQKLIFLLKHHEGMSYEEIAGEVGCSTGTAKKSVSRAVAKLRLHLDVDVQANDCVPCAAGQY
ncbi:MAG: RNA polymerase sigma factor, partial [Acidobacteriota bacterium]